MGELERMDLSRQGASADNRPAVRKKVGEQQCGTHGIQIAERLWGLLGWELWKVEAGRATWKLCAVVLKE